MRRAIAQATGPCLRTVFFDLVYAGLPGPPRPGTEVRAAHLGISPGGVANIAVALARLGLDVGLSAVFADDAFGQYLWSALVYEGIDLSLSARSPEWTTPVTTSIAYGRERSLITYEEPPPVDVAARVPDGYRADAFVVSLASARPQWLAGLHHFTPLVFADVGWDVEQLGSAAAGREVGQRRRVHAQLGRGSSVHRHRRCRTGGGRAGHK